MKGHKVLYFHHMSFCVVNISNSFQSNHFILPPGVMEFEEYGFEGVFPCFVVI